MRVPGPSQWCSVCDEPIDIGDLAECEGYPAHLQCSDGAPRPSSEFARREKAAELQADRIDDEGDYDESL